MSFRNTSVYAPRIQIMYMLKTAGSTISQKSYSYLKISIKGKTRTTAHLQFNAQTANNEIF